MKSYELRLAARLLAIAAEEFASFDDNTFDLVKEGGLARSHAKEFNQNCAQGLESNERTAGLDSTEVIVGDCGAMLYLSQRLDELADEQSKANGFGV